MPASEDKILSQARNRFDEAMLADKDERVLLDEDNRFAINDGGCQWPDQIRTQREGDMPPRPCLVVNKIPEKIDQVEGEFRQLQPSIKVRAVDSFADPQVAEILGGIIKRIEYDSAARSIYNSSHTSTLYCGRGAWRIDIVTDEEDPFVRDLEMNRIPNVLTVVWDPSAKKPDKSDATYYFITEELTDDEFKARWPKLEVLPWDKGDNLWKNWRKKDEVRIAEYWWKEKVTVDFLRVRRNGTIITIKKEDYVDGDEILDSRKGKVTKIKWCKLVAGMVLPDENGGPNKIHDYPGKLFPIVVEVGKETNVRGQTKTRGMVRFAKTPQQMYNYWTSVITEQIALAPKAPYLVTAQMIKKYQAMWNDANVKSYPYLLYDVDPGSPTGRPTREPPPMLSTAVASELSRMEHDIMSAMGIYAASLGDQGNEKSGRALIARQRQGSIGSYTYTSNFETALLYSSKVLVELIPHIYDTERIIRIRGKNDQEVAVPINARPSSPLIKQANVPDEKYLAQPRDGGSKYVNDLKMGKYDVMVSIGPSYTTQREEAMAQLLELVKAAPQLATAAMDLVVKNMDMPGSQELYERLHRMVPIEIRGLDPGEKPPEPPPPPPEVIKMFKELEMKMTETQLKIKEAMRKEFETNVNAMKTAADAEAEVGRQELMQIQTLLKNIEERQRRDDEREASQTAAQAGAGSPSTGSNVSNPSAT